jgi:hypothetical protein
MHTSFHLTHRGALEALDKATDPTNANRYTGGGIDVWVEGPGWVVEDGEPAADESEETDPNDEPDEESPRFYGRRPFQHRSY